MAGGRLGVTGGGIVLHEGRPEQLADNLAAGEKGALPEDLKAKLDEMTAAWRAVDAER